MIRDEKGQSLVEMALVIPLLILLVVGIFDIGRILYTYSELHFTTQETVRLGAFGRSNNEITDFAERNFKSGNSIDLIVEICTFKVNGENKVCSPDSLKSGDYVNVKLQYPVKTLVPFFNSIFQDPILLTSDSTIRIE
ncbi:hypothetical protein J2S74_004431 [Evansella vedderi]|uniref:TadE-like domain-containing protein n=1 Tax=Evansella vedderi TaxID=38282 RepID=A0ABU0A0G8_9BACI|nr:TadE/TadG family type IV pilus assembly protein [Evansella vedderi]MDQ0256986.1 hypothetical protein [Evansella vedderi]